MRILLIFLIVLTLSSKVQSQNHLYIDSIKQVLRSIPYDTNRMRTLGLLSWTYAGTRIKLDSARMYADSIYLLATELNHEKSIVYAHFYYGLIDRHQGNFISSLNHLNKYVNFYELRGDSSKVASGLYQMGVVHSNMGEYNQSLKELYRVLNIHKTNGFTYGIGFTTNTIATIQRTLKMYDEAITSYHKAIKAFREIDNQTDITMSMESLGNAYAELNLYDSALFYYSEALRINTVIDQQYGISSQFENLGNLYSKLGEYGKALTYQLRSLEIREKFPQKNDMASSLTKVGKTYGLLEQYDLAEQYLLESLVLSQSIKARPKMVENFNELAALNELKGDYKLANEYYKKYIGLKDSLLNEEKMKQFSEMETKYKISEKDQEIQLLSKENEITEARIAQQVVVKKALIGTILFLVILALLGYYILRQRLKNQKMLSIKNEEIRKATFEKKLSELELRALRAQMNPHFIFNCMNSINTMILHGEGDEASRYLNKFSRLLRATLENSQNTTIQLKDELIMLEAYIQLESIRFQGKISYEIKVDPSIDTENIEIPSLVLQPFIENAIWHGLMHKSTPGIVQISIIEKEDVLVCSVEDNGVGREIALTRKEQLPEEHKSMGIKITEERLKLLNKHFSDNWVQIDDLKDQHNNARGTRVNITIPIQ